MKDLPNSIEDDFWSILDNHPEFPSLPRAEQNRAFRELKASILTADATHPLSFEDSRNRLDSIFGAVGLRPLEEAQADAAPSEPNGLDGRAKELLAALDIFRAQHERERLIDLGLGVFNPDVLAELQRISFRTGWDAALHYAQARLLTAFGLGEQSDPEEDFQ